MTRLIRSLQRLALPVDTFERHALVALLASDPASVLDVGGTPGTLRLFLPRAAITTANVEPPADVLLDGARLPVGDDAFDVVTSVDVLEHLPPDARSEHLRELVRVARERVVLCCPLGTPEHVESERALAAWLEQRQGPRRFLVEHLERGLPNEDELRVLAAGAPAAFELRFHGDFRRAERLFRRGVEARRSPIRLAQYAVSRLGFRPELTLASAPTAFTNRAFLIGNL